MTPHQSIKLTEIFTDANTGQSGKRRISLDAHSIIPEKIEDLAGGGSRITTRDHKTYQVKQSGNRVGRKIMRAFAVETMEAKKSIKAFDRAMRI